MIYKGNKKAPSNLLGAFLFLFFIFPKHDTFLIGHDACAEDRINDTLFFLCAIIFQYDKRMFRQEYDRDQVGDRHKTHEEIGHIPYECDLSDRTEHYHTDYTKSETCEPNFARVEEFDVAFTVVVVTNDRREGKQEYEDRQETRSERTKL